MNRDSALAYAFGRAVRRERRLRDLSQEALADRAGIGSKHLGEIERGNHDPRLTTIFKLADGLGLTVGELLELMPAVAEPAAQRQ